MVMNEVEDVLRRRVEIRVRIPAGKVVRTRSWGSTALMLWAVWWWCWGTRIRQVYSSTPLSLDAAFVSPVVLAPPSLAYPSSPDGSGIPETERAILVGSK